MTASRYLVLALRTPAFDPALIAPHREFLDGLRAQGRIDLSGPFSDHSGGAYLLRADSLAHAQAIVARDPLAASGASAITIHEWIAA